MCEVGWKDKQRLEKGEHEDLVDLCDRVKAYIAAKEMPPGIQIQEFRDLSLLVNERLQLILKNGAMGLLLVLLTLALFLEWRIAFWVASGIAFSIIGAVALLYAVGGTINMLTLFGFLMTTGIIVDDAIVVGENFFNHKEDGGTGEEIAERSMKEIGGPVLAMVNTTLVAFLPLFFVTGLMGEFIRIIPSVVLCALVLSLFESLFILPSHLAHHSGREPSGFLAVVQFCFFPFIWISRRAQPIVNRGLNSIASGLLLPFLRFCLQHRYAVSIFFLSLLILLFGMIPAGIIKTSLFPRPDTEFHQARIEFERGTPIDVTARAARLVREAYIAAGLELEAKGDVNPTEEQFVEVGREGAHVASVQVKLKSIEEGRSITGQDFVDLWRSKIPDIPNLLSLQYTAQAGGPPSVPVEIWLTSAYNDELLEAEQATLDYLSQIEGTVDVRSDNIPGALTLEVTLKPGFRNSPSAEAEIIRTLANNYQGIKVDTFYRGDNEVKMWVRSALRDRRSLAELRQTQLPSGLRIDQIAQLNLTREEAEIRRVDGERTITISSDIDRSRGANAAEIRSKMEQDWLWQIAQRYPTVRWQHSGESKEGGEAIDSMLQAYIPALFAIYLILATVFRSYTQPLIIMFAIPFAFVGAVVGHFVMDIPVNLLSLFGIVGLTGIAVNDSLVLIDCINSEREKNGKQLLDALQTASRRRLRPILLTSLTTIAGMSPILFETSFQAQFLIPMVTSIVFGIGAATILILVLIPVCYAILADILEIAATFSPRGRKS
jgi:multidrug efflux pump subunit AcrB